MRISDWSSDVCSSDLTPPPGFPAVRQLSGCVVRSQRTDKARRRGRSLVDHSRSDCLAPLRARSDHWQDEGASSRTASGNAVQPGASGWVQQSTRSEEHTSELQSLMRISYAVFCLKKKKKKK